MNAKDWQAIEQAREVLGLGDRVTLAEIKRAYHRLSKQHHPDTAKTAKCAKQRADVPDHRRLRTADALLQ